MFTLVQSNAATVTVKGTISDKDGKRKSFDFVLLCDRAEVEEFEALANDKDKRLADFLASKVTGWRGIKDTDGVDVPYTPEQFANLMKVPGIPVLAFTEYAKEVQAVAKN